MTIPPMLAISQRIDYILLEMARVNKLHELLYGVPVWTDELKEQAFKFIDAHSALPHIELLAALTGNELAGRHVIGQKKDVLRVILNQASPQTVLKAWEQIRTEYHLGAEPNRL